MNMLEVDKTLKSFFESDVFTSLDDPQKLSVATVMRAMYEAMQRENDKPKNKGADHSCDIPGCAVCDPCYGL